MNATPGIAPVGVSVGCTLKFGLDGGPVGQFDSNADSHYERHKAHACNKCDTAAPIIPEPPEGASNVGWSRLRKVDTGL